MSHHSSFFSLIILLISFFSLYHSSFFFFAFVTSFSAFFQHSFGLTLLGSLTPSPPVSLSISPSAPPPSLSLPASYPCVPPVFEIEANASGSFNYSDADDLFDLLMKESLNRVGDMMVFDLVTIAQDYMPSKEALTSSIARCMHEHAHVLCSILLCIYMHVHIRMYTCILHMHVNTFTCMYMYMYMHIHVYITHACVHVYVHVHRRERIFILPVDKYTCTCTCIYSRRIKMSMYYKMSCILNRNLSHEVEAR